MRQANAPIPCANRTGLDERPGSDRYGLLRVEQLSREGSNADVRASNSRTSAPGGSGPIPWSISVQSGYYRMSRPTARDGGSNEGYAGQEFPGSGRRGARLLHRQSRHRRRHPRARGGGHPQLGRGHRPGGRPLERAGRRRRSVGNRAPLADDVPRRILPGGQGVRLRDQRDRHRAVGYQGQGRRHAGIPAARRPGARQGGVLPALAGGDHAGAGRQRQAPGRRRLALRALGPAGDLRECWRRPAARCSIRTSR